MEPTKEQWYLRRIAELQAEVAELKAQVARRTEQGARQSEQIARLSEQMAKLSKNSSNSSKPPSSDIVKPPKPASSKKTKRKIGGQPVMRNTNVRRFPLNRSTTCASTDCIAVRTAAAR